MSGLFIPFPHELCYLFSPLKELEENLSLVPPPPKNKTPFKELQGLAGHSLVLSSVYLICTICWYSLPLVPCVLVFGCLFLVEIIISPTTESTSPLVAKIQKSAYRMLFGGSLIHACLIINEHRLASLAAANLLKIHGIVALPIPWRNLGGFFWVVGSCVLHLYNEQYLASYIETLPKDKQKSIFSVLKEPYQVRPEQKHLRQFLTIKILISYITMLVYVYAPTPTSPLKQTFVCALRVRSIIYAIQSTVKLLWCCWRPK